MAYGRHFYHLAEEWIHAWQLVEAIYQLQVRVVTHWLMVEMSTICHGKDFFQNFYHMPQNDHLPFAGLPSVYIPRSSPVPTLRPPKRGSLGSHSCIFSLSNDDRPRPNRVWHCDLVIVIISPAPFLSTPAGVQIGQKTLRIGCVIPRCKLQCGITQPIFWLSNPGAGVGCLWPKWQVHSTYYVPLFYHVHYITWTAQQRKKEVRSHDWAESPFCLQFLPSRSNNFAERIDSSLLNEWNKPMFLRRPSSKKFMRCTLSA